MTDLVLDCNHHRDGRFVNGFLSISLADPGLLTLTTPYVGNWLRYHFEGRVLVIGKDGRFPHGGRKRRFPDKWTDRVRFADRVAAAALNFCIGKGYRPTVAEDSIWKAIEAGRPIEAAMGRRRAS
jgi:hypothetical protein